MSFKITPDVHVERDGHNVVRHLAHIQTPFSPADAAGKSAEAIGASYVRDVAWIYGIPGNWLEQLESSAPDLLAAGDAPRSEPPDQLRLAHVKSVMETTVVSFGQLRHGIPVWEAGVSVVVQSHPQRVTSSQSSLHFDVDSAVPDPNVRFSPKAISSEVLAAQLKLPRGAKPRVNRVRWVVYRYDPDQRTDPEIEGHTDEAHVLDGPPPTLPLPELPTEIRAGAHYVVSEVLFTHAVDKLGDVHWRAFIEVTTGAVLYLRAFVAHATGAVFVTDPLTASGGTTPASSLAVLNPLRTNVQLPDLDVPPPATPQALTGKYVKLVNISPPPVAPPTALDGVFVYDATTDNFSAVNAYHHCDQLFRLMESMGFDVFAFFDGTAATPGFPVPVDHRALGNVVNAQGPGNMFGDGSNGFRFALAQLGTTVGIADDPRVVAHEFCHALLWDSVHSPNFGFAHSAGDALGAILSDPGSLAPDRFMTFPWIAAGTPGLARRHDRPVGAGWAWGGVNDVGSYSSEQILATSLFRLYRAAGGDSGLPNPTARRAIQELTARWIAYLIIRGIGSLATSPITPSPTPNVFVTALMNADIGTALFDGKPGGLVHKVVRWAFEKQGLFQAPGTPKPITQPGLPPDVDVYIDDGRAGEYLPHLDDVRSTTEIWNRRTPDPSSSPLDHQVPIAGLPNYLFVRVKNRGTLGASDVVVRGYRAKPGSARMWPADWTPMTTPSVALPAGVPIGGSAVAGPFQWTPMNQGDELVMMTVSATGDPSNIDAGTLLPSATGPTPDELLVRLDNNTAQRQLAPIGNPDPCAVTLPERDACCESPCAPPWVPFDQCLSWYDYRLFPWTGNKDQRQTILVFRVVYHHCLKLKGRQQGPLLFTTTLLPGEQMKLYHFERHRRTRATSDTFSVHASFRQIVSALHQTRTRDSSDQFTKVIDDVRADGDTNITIGGMLFPVSFDAEDHDTHISLEVAASASHVADDFHQTLTVSSQQLDIERSIVVSTFEEKESQDSTTRTIKNENECYAVTYFVRRVMETYVLETTVERAEWKLAISGAASNPWRSIDDTQGVPNAVVQAIVAAKPALPVVGSKVEPNHAITIPSDGTLYEAELAHCSSCEPEREAGHLIELAKQKAEAHKACLESQLLELEVKRRQQLLAAGELDPFEASPPNAP